MFYCELESFDLDKIEPYDTPDLEAVDKIINDLIEDLKKPKEVSSDYLWGMN